MYYMSLKWILSLFDYFQVSRIRTKAKRDGGWENAKEKGKGYKKTRTTKGSWKRWSTTKTLFLSRFLKHVPFKLLFFYEIEINRDVFTGYLIHWNIKLKIKASRSIQLKPLLTISPNMKNAGMWWYGHFKLSGQ